MLEMRTYISDRFITKRQGVLRWRHPIGPNMMKIYNANIQVSTVCAAKNIGGLYIYEVSFEQNKRVSVDLLNRKCYSLRPMQ